jgi:hypothetical protein
MARSLLRQVVGLATALVIAATALFGVGVWRRSQDAAWCRDVIARQQGHQAVPPEHLDRYRSSCAARRQDQRVLFGSLWRTGGRRMAECGFELARLQLVSDPETQGVILEAHGLDNSTFDSGSRRDQSRFIDACAVSRR